ncbi:MAG: hypothetical protein GXO35_00875 [Gammaproteobacteria bacterium]|nr:hypothetical protein [Gammaproteobacteria bacterium]
MKDVVLLYDDPSTLKSLPKATKFLLPVLFSPTWSKKLSQTDLLRRSVHVCLTPNSLQNKEYMSFLKHLLEVKKKEYGKENTVLKTKALLFEEISLPNELSDMQPIKIHSDLPPENIATFLEGSITANYNAAVARVQELGIGK